MFFNNPQQNANANVQPPVNPVNPNNITRKVGDDSWLKNNPNGTFQLNFNNNGSSDEINISLANKKLTEAALAASTAWVKENGFFKYIGTEKNIRPEFLHENNCALFNGLNFCSTAINDCVHDAKNCGVFIDENAIADIFKDVETMKKTIVRVNPDLAANILIRFGFNKVKKNITINNNKFVLYKVETVDNWIKRLTEGWKGSCENTQLPCNDLVAKLNNIKVGDENVWNRKNKMTNLITTDNILIDVYKDLTSEQVNVADCNPRGSYTALYKDNLLRPVGFDQNAININNGNYVDAPNAGGAAAIAAGANNVTVVAGNIDAINVNPFFVHQNAPIGYAMLYLNNAAAVANNADRYIDFNNNYRNIVDNQDIPVDVNKYINVPLYNNKYINDKVIDIARPKGNLITTAGGGGNGAGAMTPILPVERTIIDNYNNVCNTDLLKLYILHTLNGKTSYNFTDATILSPFSNSRLNTIAYMAAIGNSPYVSYAIERPFDRHTLYPDNAELDTFTRDKIINGDYMVNTLTSSSNSVVDSIKPLVNYDSIYNVRATTENIINRIADNFIIKAADGNFRNSSYANFIRSVISNDVSVAKANSIVMNNIENINKTIIEFNNSKNVNNIVPYNGPYKDIYGAIAILFLTDIPKYSINPAAPDAVANAPNEPWYNRFVNIETDISDIKNLYDRVYSELNAMKTSIEADRQSVNIAANAAAIANAGAAGAVADPAAIAVYNALVPGNNGQGAQNPIGANDVATVAAIPNTFDAANNLKTYNNAVVNALLAMHAAIIALKDRINLINTSLQQIGLTQINNDLGGYGANSTIAGAYAMINTAITTISNNNSDFNRKQSIELMGTIKIENNIIDSPLDILIDNTSNPIENVSNTYFRTVKIINFLGRHNVYRQQQQKANLTAASIELIKSTSNLFKPLAKAAADSVKPLIWLSNKDNVEAFFQSMDNLDNIITAKIANVPQAKTVFENIKNYIKNYKGYDTVIKGGNYGKSLRGGAPDLNLFGNRLLSQLRSTAVSRFFNLLDLLQKWVNANPQVLNPEFNIGSTTSINDNKKEQVILPPSSTRFNIYSYYDPYSVKRNQMYDMSCEIDRLTRRLIEKNKNGFHPLGQSNIRIEDGPNVRVFNGLNRDYYNNQNTFLNGLFGALKGGGLFSTSGFGDVYNSEFFDNGKKNNNKNIYGLFDGEIRVSRLQNYDMLKSIVNSIFRNNILVRTPGAIAVPSPENNVVMTCGGVVGTPINKNGSSVKISNSTEKAIRDYVEKIKSVEEEFMGTLEKIINRDQIYKMSNGKINAFELTDQQIQELIEKNQDLSIVGTNLNDKVVKILTILKDLLDKIIDKQ